ncbi:metallophosphoesterase family protein [bacterium]|nr:metallophosphoesterase family protein [bacterium]
MKIAVISDIHGNMEAIEAVMNDIQIQGCEKVFVLGDYAMAGPEPCAAIDWFMKQEGNPNYHMIQGNTDLMLADYSNEIYQTLQEKAPIMAEALKDDFFQTNPVQRTFLKNLPEQKLVKIDGVNILLVHGSPRQNNEDILPTTSMGQVENMLADIDPDINVVLCGHTHIPCGFQTSTKQTVINVGSIGRPFTPEPKSCYLKLTINNGKCVFEHRFIKYNNERAAMKLRGREFAGVNKLANTLLEPNLRHF